MEPVAEIHLKESELRVGNWARNAYTGSLHQFTNGLDIDIEAKYCEGISLTPELLETFMERDQFLFYDDDRSFRVNNFRGGDVFFFQMAFTDPNGGPVEWMTLQDISYLHQLQNIYFPLAGKELEVNL